MKNPGWHIASYYFKDGDVIICTLCPHHCRISHGKSGRCKIRFADEDKLYTMAFGNLCALHRDPIEKKPLFHFLPGSKVFSIASPGCNLNCTWCQNWEISQQTNYPVKNSYSPEQVVEMAVEHGCQSVAFTYTEPVVYYEFMLKTAQFALSKGLLTVMVSNGFINREPLQQLLPHLSAANIDLKSFNEQSYHKLTKGHLQPVLQTLDLLHKHQVWLEITYLVIPGINDSLSEISIMCEWLSRNDLLGVPIHFNRYFPTAHFKQIPPTPTEQLESICKQAKKLGCQFVYGGNFPSNFENTYCPVCNKILIHRAGYTIYSVDISMNHCPNCQTSIPGVWSTA